MCWSRHRRFGDYIQRINIVVVWRKLDIFSKETADNRWNEINNEQCRKARAFVCVFLRDWVVNCIREISSPLKFCHNVSIIPVHAFKSLTITSKLPIAFIQPQILCVTIQMVIWDEWTKRKEVKILSKIKKSYDFPWFPAFYGEWREPKAETYVEWCIVTLHFTLYCLAFGRIVFYLFQLDFIIQRPLHHALITSYDLSVECKYNRCTHDTLMHVM